MVGVGSSPLLPQLALAFGRVPRAWRNFSSGLIVLKLGPSSSAIRLVPITQPRASVADTVCLLVEPELSCLVSALCDDLYFLFL